jgi:hypothetical protein
LSLVQAKEYVRARLCAQMQTETWRFEELFALLDSEDKGWIGVFDVERFLSTHTKVG